MTVAERLRNDWKDDLRELFADARSSLIVSSPYITMRGADFLLSCLNATAHATVDVSVLTDLSPMNVAQASTDPSAIRRLAAVLQRTNVFHIPRLHAKVYVKDADRAIVTSGNLTTGGLDVNYEYGLNVLDPQTAAAIRRDVIEYSQLGALVPFEALNAYSEAAVQLRDLYRAQEREVRRADIRLRGALRAAADRLVGLRLAGGGMYTIFAATILYLLGKHGPMLTTELHPRIEAMHPDLCDNSVDRVIHGKRFGRKWKHAVRTAQQHLKQREQIALIDKRWTLLSQAKRPTARR